MLYIIWIILYGYCVEQNSNNNFRNNNRVNNPPKRKSNSLAPKTNLTSAEKKLFRNTKPNDVKYNLSKEEKSALKNWKKDVLFNKESELVIRLQDKGKRFVIVDTETDKIKAQQQIAKSSFQEPSYTIFGKRKRNFERM